MRLRLMRSGFTVEPAGDGPTEMRRLARDGKGTQNPPRVIGLWGYPDLPSQPSQVAPNGFIR